jgi:equilibrative nucleoside transporter 1/2/3
MRLIFFPLFLLCKLSDSQLPILFASDCFPILFTILFGFTNGYVATSCMVYGAKSQTEAKDSALGGTIMIFSLNFGLFIGSCFSFLIVFISQGSF